MLRRAPHGPKRMTRASYAVLAALLLADGERVATLDLARGLYARPVKPVTIHQRVRAIRWLGVSEIATCWLGGVWHGYRLTGLPSDEHLDGMLACVPAVRRSSWWARRMEQAERSA